MSNSPAWTRKEGKNPEGGLNEKGRASLRAAGHDIKRPQPEGGSRKDSFCARMKGMKEKLTSSETANDPDSRINKSLRKWNCRADGGAIDAAMDVAKKYSGKIYSRHNSPLVKGSETTPRSTSETTEEYPASDVTPEISKEQYRRGKIGNKEFALSKGGRTKMAVGGEPAQSLRDPTMPFVDPNPASPSQQYVSSLYKNILGRQADPSGMSGWVEDIESGDLNAGDILTQFAQSPEFQNVYKSDPTKAITTLYQTALGRDPEQAGLQGWVNSATGGMGLGDITQAFLNSQEGQNVAGIREAYRDYANSLPTAEQLQQGQQLLGQNEDYSNFLQKAFPAPTDDLSGVQEARAGKKTRTDASPIPQFSDDARALAEMMWSEADVFRGQPDAERKIAGTGWSAKNRALAGFKEGMPKWYAKTHDPNSIKDQITNPGAGTGAYSYFNKSREKMAKEAFEKNPELEKYYMDLANKIISGEMEDPTGGSMSYYNPKAVKRTPGFAGTKGKQLGWYNSVTDPNDGHVYFGNNKYTPIALAKQYEQALAAGRTFRGATPTVPPDQPFPGDQTGVSGGVGAPQVGIGVPDVGGGYPSAPSVAPPSGYTPVAPHSGGTPHPVTHTPGTHVGGGSHTSSGDHGSFGVSYAGDPYFGHAGVGGSGHIGGATHTGGSDPYFGHVGSTHYDPRYGSGVGGPSSDWEWDYAKKRGGRVGGMSTKSLENAKDVIGHYKSGGPVWDKPRPKSLGKPEALTSGQKASAKAAAKAAGRPYPNLVDNMRAAKKD